MRDMSFKKLKEREFKGKMQKYWILLLDVHKDINRFSFIL